MEFQDIYDTPGENRTGGLQAIGYYAPVEDIDATQWPEVPADPEDLEASITVTGDIVMKSGKKMLSMYGTVEKSGLDGEGQGERDSQSTKRTATWQIPGSSKTSLGFAKSVLNRGFVFIYLENDGQKRVHGSPKVPCMVVPKDSTGKGSGEFKGVGYEISDFGHGPCPIYEGVLPLVASV